MPVYLCNEHMKRIKEATMVEVTATAVKKINEQLEGRQVTAIRIFLDQGG